MSRLLEALPRADDPGSSDGRWGGVAGNARLTGLSGAALFVFLAAEGVTVLQVRQLVSVHVFLGMLLVPLVLLKTASTGYRAASYYRGDPDYTRKGPPPLIMRAIGPFVVLTTLAVLGTGIALIAAGRSDSWLKDAHKASFILWFGLMAVHVLGHLRETPTLAAGDVRTTRGATVVAGGRTRIALVVGAIVVGVGLGVLSLGWVGTFHGGH